VEKRITEKVVGDSFVLDLMDDENTFVVAVK